MSNSRPETDKDLLAGLILEAGRLVEYAAPMFALTWPEGTIDQQQRIEELSELAESLKALAAAAAVLHRHNNRISP